MSLRIQRFSSFEEMAEILPEWDGLAASITPWLPFMTPAWARQWWTTYRRDSALLRDTFFVHTLRDESGALVGVAPLIIRTVPLLRPLRLRLVDFFGADPSVTEVRGFVCHPRDRARVWLAMREHLRKDGLHLLTWRGLGEAERDLAQGLGLSSAISQESPTFIVTVPQTWEALLKGLSKNARRAVRRPFEILERDGMTFTFTATRPEGIPETLIRLHQSRADADDMGVKHHNRFDDAKINAFLSGIARAMAKDQRLVVFELHIDGKCVASRLAYVSDKDIYVFYSGFDPALRKYSVMTILMAEIIRWAMTQNFERVNLSAGSDPSKLRWSPQECPSWCVEEHGADFGSALVALAKQTLHQVRALRSRIGGYRSTAQPTAVALIALLLGLA